MLRYETYENSDSLCHFFLSDFTSKVNSLSKDVLLYKRNCTIVGLPVIYLVEYKCDK